MVNMLEVCALVMSAILVFYLFVIMLLAAICFSCTNVPIQSMDVSY